MHRRPLLALALLVLAAAAAHAADPVNKTRFGGLAVDGYDVVAYFTDDTAVEGSKDFTYEWNGAKWRFASAAHRDAFAAEPEKYAPQYGGYCAWAVSRGYTANGDPEAWTLYEGKLYLNYNQKIMADWSADKAGNIAKADANWPAVLEE